MKSISRLIDARLPIAACASSIGTLFPGLGPLWLTGSLAGWLLGLIAMRWPWSGAEFGRGGLATSQPSGGNHEKVDERATL
jgi:hypothetical protein